MRGEQNKADDVKRRQTDMNKASMQVHCKFRQTLQKIIKVKFRLIHISISMITKY